MRSRKPVTHTRSCGFITRRGGRLRSVQPYTVLVKTHDTGHARTVRVSDGPVVTTPNETGVADATFTGTVQLYLGLRNRAEITATGVPGVIDEWKQNVRVRWN
jgi:hypothetical protein